MGKHKEKSKKHKTEKHKKEKKKHKKKEYSTSESSTEDEWVEKRLPDSPKRTDVEKPENKREDWFSLPSNFLTASNEDRRKQRQETRRVEKEQAKYDPGKCSRELNPYWKDGGDGLPSAMKFKKPSEEGKDESRKDYKYGNTSSSRSSNWRKKSTIEEVSKEKNITIPVKDEKPPELDDESNTLKVLSDKELNSLAAKLIKAEIMGNTKMIAQLKIKLEEARNLREAHPDIAKIEDQEVILTRTDSKGYARPVKMSSEHDDGPSRKQKKQKIETHTDGERVRYFADDDNISLKQMFENEKFNSVEEQNSEFLKLAGKIRKNDDLDEVFADNIRQKESDSKTDRRNKDKAIGEHQRISSSLDHCNRCIQSDNMLKNLMVSMGNTTYLSLPSYEPITTGHCFIIPVRHSPCATQLDENEWAELMDFRKALTRMFLADDDDVIFFETAMYLNRHPHMYIECVPLPKEIGDLAPIYFKKAIDDSEMEWSTNKKLVSLAGKDVRKAIPKGLPYFSVSFGMQEGYAHVIEDQELFPSNFAQEIIGGMLDLHHSKWRKPKRQSFEDQSKRVLEFSKKWNTFDCTK